MLVLSALNFFIYVVAMKSGNCSRQFQSFATELYVAVFHHSTLVGQRLTASLFSSLPIYEGGMQIGLLLKL